MRSRATILLLGLALTGVSVSSLGTLRSAALAEQLSNSGVELVDSAHQAVGTGLERTRGLSALLHASDDVTPAEFERYAREIGPGLSVVSVGYESLAGSQPLTFSYRTSDVGGSELLSSQNLEPIIARFGLTRQPASLGLMDVAGTVLVVGPVFAPDSEVEVAGFVYTVLELQYLTERAPEGMGFGFWETRPEDFDFAASADRRTWRKTDLVAGRPWTFEVVRTDPPELDFSLLLVAVFGVVGSAFASSRIGLGADKQATEFALDALKQATADKDRFMASVSHELRTPLTSVVGLSSILETSWREMDTQDVQRMITDVHHEGRELADLVEDLLTIGRVESGVLTYRPSTIELDDEVARVVSRIQVPTHVRVEVGEMLGSARADALRTRQIVRNLLANAARHAAGVIEVSPVRGHGVVGVRVANDGPGIPRDQVARLFQAYQAGLRSGQPGSIGLGLFVSRQLARGMGGDLRFVPEYEKVIFELTLPSSGDGAATGGGVEAVISGPAS